MLTSELAKELNTTIKDLKSVAKECSISISSGKTELSEDETKTIKNYIKKGKDEKKQERMIIVKKNIKPSEETQEPKKVKPVKKVKIKIKKVVKKAPEQGKTKEIEKKPAVITKEKEAAEEKKHTKYHESKRTHKHEKELLKEKDIQFRKKRKQKPQFHAVPKSIDIMETVSVAELAKKMNLKASTVIQKLMDMGVMATINQIIDAETAQILAEEFKCEVHIVSLYDETLIEEQEDKEEDLLPRPPIVTVMGHVDHGKTTLLDYIRNTKVASGEEGGITQHIGAYKVKTKSGEIVFLDTPGHEAFTAMRNRGAQVTDIVILVVAADEGAKPQTIEALNHAKAAEVPIIVAVNKMDSEGANPDRVKQQLSEYELLPEEWGGDTQFVNVSAISGQGIDDLLESILLTAEILELKANPNKEAIGTIVESRIDRGRGPVATVLIESGTIKVGDNFLAGIHFGKVRALFDWEGNNVSMALPATPIEVLGLDGVPEAGDPFHVVTDEKTAKDISEKRHELNKFEQAKNVKKVTLDNLYEAIQDGNITELKLVIKADVQGSVEAIKDSLEKLSTSEVKVKVIHSGTGGINHYDVMLASASDAIIIGFHVRPNKKAMELAESEGVDIRKYGVIYDVIDEVKNAMEGLLAPIIKEEVYGTAEVRETFKVTRLGTIAGCYVTSGKVTRNSRLRIVRDGVVVYEGVLDSLKRFKDDVKEVSQGYECGVMIQNYNDIKKDDELEFYREVKIAKKLSDTKKK